MKQFLIVSALLILLLVLALYSGQPSPNNYYDIEGLTLEQVKQQSSASTSESPKLAIAFGGGGVRGFMHLGVIKALEEANIKADIVTGTSAGSLAAALYSSGMSYQQISDIVLNLSETDLADIVVSKEGLINGQFIAQWINEQSQQMPIEGRDIALGIAVTDLTHEQALLIVEGDAGHAVQASASIPGVMIPVQTPNATYVDGGVLALVPVEFAYAMGANVVLAVDIYCDSPEGMSPNFIGTLLNAFRIQACKINELEIAQADHIIRPVFVVENFQSFAERDDMIELAYQETLKVIPALKAQLSAF
ncbi:patatin-like phospholipase family protein [Thalassotalea agarivorans]|uniref:NTE family protein n=1 Tax=Thalassotalea agarivorans TaxID=349064 RepID=A0A1I0HPL2_THASX|nr:patatin-like phospholipase family protein [Thalassotalea agarivorans]SET85062.1 NTE family protein [Thalassotalea agarivorans]